MDLFSSLFTGQSDAGQVVRPLPSSVTPATDFFSQLFTAIPESACAKQERQALISSSDNGEEESDRGSGRSQVEPS
jgi:hypothetical protein